MKGGDEERFYKQNQIINEGREVWRGVYGFMRGGCYTVLKSLERRRNREK
jgi:hypothetical protein